MTRTDVPLQGIHGALASALVQESAIRVVIVEGIFPNAAFETGMGINVLIGDDEAPPNGGGAFHDCAVWLSPA